MQHLLCGKRELSQTSGSTGLVLSAISFQGWRDIPGLDGDTTEKEIKLNKHTKSPQPTPRLELPDAFAAF